MEFYKMSINYDIVFCVENKKDIKSIISIYEDAIIEELFDNVKISKINSESEIPKHYLNEIPYSLHSVNRDDLTTAKLFKQLKNKK